MTSRCRLQEIRELKPKQKLKSELNKKKTIDKIRDDRETKERLYKAPSKTKLKFDPKLAKQNLKKVGSLLRKIFH